MNSLDYNLVAVQVVLLVWLGVRLNRTQETEENYYVGAGGVRKADDKGFALIAATRYRFLVAAMKAPGRVIAGRSPRPLRPR